LRPMHVALSSHAHLAQIELELPQRDGGEGEARHVRKERGRRRSPAAGHSPPFNDVIATCATSDLFLKHLDETYV
jgi:hypothetical protein